jgi:hypothetical protein
MNLILAQDWSSFATPRRFPISESPASFTGLIARYAELITDPREAIKGICLIAQQTVQVTPRKQA